MSVMVPTYLDPTFVRVDLISFTESKRPSKLPKKGELVASFILEKRDALLERSPNSSSIMRGSGKKVEIRQRLISTEPNVLPEFKICVFKNSCPTFSIG